MNRPLRIGELARQTGLSVRALRHYDARGLVRPQGRSAAGHRLYAPSDVARLHRVVTLRALGLGLASIAEALDASDPDPAALLRGHLAHLRAQIALHQQLAAHIEALLTHYAQGPVHTRDLLHTIHLTTMFEKHYTPEQLEQLRDHAATLGPDHLAGVQQQWADLFAAFERHREAGTSSSDSALQPLVAQAWALIGEFTGGDPDLRASLGEAYAQSKSAMYQAWGVSPELGAYYDRAMEASNRD